MQSRSELSLTQLPTNILFEILLHIGLDVLPLKLTCKLFNHAVNSILADSHIIYWETLGKKSLPHHQLQLFDKTHYKAILTKRFFSKKLIENSLTGDNPYIMDMYINSLKITSPKIEFHHDFYDEIVINNEFIKNVQRLLLDDNSSGLLCLVSPKLMKLIDCLSSNEEKKSQILNSVKKLRQEEKINLLLKDLSFVGLLPIAIKLNAIHCFELLVKAYLHIYTLISHSLKAEGENRFNISNVYEIVASSKNNFFIESFMRFVLRICDTSVILSLIDNNSNPEEISKWFFKILSTSNIEKDKLKIIHTFIENRMNIKI